MSSPADPAPIEPLQTEPNFSPATTSAERPAAPRVSGYGRAVLLFVLTACTTTTLGALWMQLIRTEFVVTNSIVGPALTPGLVAQVWTDPALLLLGLQFSLPALAILLAHELGHVFACRAYGLDSTPPYFLPAPVGFGTFGAFIRIHTRISSRRELFDVGVSGPLAGFAVLVPFLIYGIAHSEPVAVDFASPNEETSLILPVVGQNLGFLLVSRWFHGPLGTEQLNLHPFALAAWLGMLATAINLLPFGQLDGGHIFYAAAGRWQQRLAWPLWFAMAGLGIWTRSWLLWCLLTLILGVVHPRMGDQRPLDLGRRVLAFVALGMLVVCFIPVPLVEKPIRWPQGVEFATSSTKVTGPSLTSSTAMSAPNRPVSTR